MYMLIFKLQTQPEPTQTRKPAYLNLDSPPYHRRVIVWSPLLFGIFPLSVSGSPNMKASRRVIPDTPPNSPPSSSELSSIPSEVEKDLDLIENQKLAPPREGNNISSAEWTPIATTSYPGVEKRANKKKREVHNNQPTRFPVWTPSFTPLDSGKRQPGKKPNKKKKTVTPDPFDKKTTKKQPIRKPPKEMDATSLSNNSNENSNAREESSRNETTDSRTQEPELDLLDYSEEMTRDTNSAQPQPSGFESLTRNLPSLSEASARIRTSGALPTEQGISPALINSRATSLALETMSTRSTPVPRPIERQEFAVHMNTATGHQIQSLTPRQLNPTPSPALNQTPALEGPEDIIVDNPQLETVINLFNDQWLMFVQARENQNVPMMRFALQQAAGSQEVIRNLAGGEEMLRICKNWIAREELADLERSEQHNPTPQVQRLAITQRAHSHTISPSPAPLPLARQTSEIMYLGRGQQPAQDQLPTQRPQTAQSQHLARGNHLPPPPPPSTQPPPASAYYNQHRQGHHHPYYRQGGSQHQQQIVPNYEQHHQAQVAQTHEPQQRRFHPAPQGNWRGYGRNHRDPTTRLLQVGDYLMRAERVAGRVFRYRGRGRGRNQVQRQGNPQEEPHQ
ncbi:hypothetical protein PGT21_022063 [Puccinia graminis f. sp. tritici]|uniref:Uncharacterized protein n=1 Tax=Puccinia graminis f. sp. tritici TaxID=56615 RepID=A0A5B0QWR0_PUCGR|nr:hypothetical protein PGT21_022063 [Puccinia graminis f. sp. tritici]